jgi:hypothetical protein
VHPLFWVSRGRLSSRPSSPLLWQSAGLRPTKSDGSKATRFGLESHPVVSSGGSKLAFAGEYDGNLDDYVVATTGGQPADSHIARPRSVRGVYVGRLGNSTPCKRLAVFSVPFTGWLRILRARTIGKIRHGRDLLPDLVRIMLTVRPRSWRTSPTLPTW